MKEEDIDNLDEEKEEYPEEQSDNIKEEIPEESSEEVIGQMDDMPVDEHGNPIAQYAQDYFDNLNMKIAEKKRLDAEKQKNNSDEKKDVNPENKDINSSNDAVKKDQNVNNTINQEKDQKMNKDSNVKDMHINKNNNIQPRNTPSESNVNNNINKKGNINKNKLNQFNEPGANKLPKKKNQYLDSKKNKGKSLLDKPGLPAKEGLAKKGTKGLADKAKDGIAKKATKNVAKKAAKDTAKKAAEKATKAVVKKVATAAASLAAKLLMNPYFWIVLGIIVVVVVLIVLIAAIIAGAAGGGTGGGEAGEGKYYDPTCNFNRSKVEYVSESETYTDISLDEFVISATYTYLEEGNYSKDTIKTVLVIMKTNALSYGGYNKSTQHLSISNEHFDNIKIEEVDNRLYRRIKEFYEDVSGEIYISESYDGTIDSLSNSNALVFDDSKINEIEDLQKRMSYKRVLNQLYNDGTNRKIYKLKDHCKVYEIKGNDAWWWPIGSAEPEPTATNIYGGDPTSLKINSYFGPREVEGTADNHGAIDIDGSSNVDIVIASKSGTVVSVSNECDNNGFFGNTCGVGFGNHVRIDHGDGVIGIYAHMYPNSITVSEGDSIKQGQKIGMVGNSGSSTGPHLHFEMRLNGVKIDPLDYVSPEFPRPQDKYNIAATGDEVLPPNEAKAAICNSLLEGGFSQNAVAGMLVNIAAEGSFMTNNLEGCYEEDVCCTVNGKPYGFCVHPEIRGFGTDDGYTAGVDSGDYPREKFVNDRAGYGLIQWTSSGRKAGLYDKAKNESKSIANLGLQLDWLLEELKSPGYTITYKYITGTYSAYDIATNFCLDFESPANENVVCPGRAAARTPEMLSFVKNGCQ